MANLTTTGTLKAALAAKLDDRSAAVAAIIANLTGGKIVVKDGGTVVAEASLVISTNAADELVIPQTALVTSAEIDPAETDLTLHFCNVLANGELSGPIDGDTFTLNTTADNPGNVTLNAINFTVESTEVFDPFGPPGPPGDPGQPPVITQAPGVSQSTSTKWAIIRQGTGAVENDQWNVTTWGLDGTITQTVSIGAQTNQQANSFRLQSSVPRNWPWPNAGDPNTEVKSFPKFVFGQPPGYPASTHPNLPIQVKDIQSIWTGDLGRSGTVNGHGQLAHDMRLSINTTPSPGNYALGASFVRHELFVVVEAYENYGAHPNGRAANRYHGQHSIGGNDWYIYIQPGATFDPAGNNNPQLIWLPVNLPVANPLDIAPLIEWGKNITPNQLPIIDSSGNPAGTTDLIVYGQTANDPMINEDLFLVSNAIGIEVDEGDFDRTVDTFYFEVN